MRLKKYHPLLLEAGHYNRVILIWLANIQFEIKGEK